MRFRWVRAGVALGLIVCGAAAWFAVHYVVQARHQSTAGAVAQGLAAVLVPVAGLAVWLVTRFRPGVPEIDIEHAADNLARRVEQQWYEEERQRGLLHRPLAVSWTWSRHRLSGSRRAAAGGRRAMRIAPLPGVPRTKPRQLKKGDLGDLFKVYGGLSSGRIVLVGAPGAGKSGAMISLLLDAINHRKGIQEDAERAKVPVPVLLSAYDWLPEHEGLTDWVAQRLEEEHPFLKARAKGSAETVSAARALVNDGAISLLLDGVDEMPEAARTAVLRQIGRQAGYRVVLSSRTDELKCAVDGGHLVGAAALELAAITARKAADYLKSHAIRPIPDSWDKLIEHLRKNKTSPVAHALDTPLMLSLLLDTYRPHDPVDELIDEERFPGREEIEEHLLARVLTAAYTPRPGDPAPPCTLGQAWRWLGNLAARMKQDDTRDLAWWRIPQWLPSRHWKISIGLAVGLINGLASALVFGIAAGIVFGPTSGLVTGLAVGPASGVVFGLTVGLAFGLAVELRAGLAVGLATGVEVGLAAGIMGGLRFGLNFGLAVGITSWLTIALTTALTIGLTAGFTSSLDTTNDSGFPPQYRGLRGRGGLPIGDIAGVLAVGLAVGLVLGLVFGLAAGLAAGLAVGLPIGLGSGIAAGVGSGLASGLTQALNISIPADKLATPVDSYQGNRRLVLAVGIAAGVAVGVTSGIAFGISAWVEIGLRPGVLVGVAAGVAFGVLAGIAAGATNVNFFLPAFVAFALMRLAGRGPVRMMGFLEDARRRGVLRTAGPVYQFRHARLQDLLADSFVLCDPVPLT